MKKAMMMLPALAVLATVSLSCIKEDCKICQKDRKDYEMIQGCWQIQNAQSLFKGKEQKKIESADNTLDINTLEFDCCNVDIKYGQSGTKAPEKATYLINDKILSFKNYRYRISFENDELVLTSLFNDWHELPSIDAVNRSCSYEGEDLYEDPAGKYRKDNGKLVRCYQLDLSAGADKGRKICMDEEKLHFRKQAAD